MNECPASASRVQDRVPTEPRWLPNPQKPQRIPCWNRANLARIGARFLTPPAAAIANPVAMTHFAELLARKTQLKVCLAEASYTRQTRESMMAELKKLSREIERWIQRHAAF